MPSPLVSVLIPTYNSAAYLPEAVRSVLAQNFDRESVEVIVVDDGSDDDVAGAIASFGTRVRLITVPHQGVSAARNEGIWAARGQYVALLDADDFWLPGRLQALCALVHDEPRALCTSDFYLERAGVRSTTPHYHELGLARLFLESPQAQLRALLQRNFLSYMQLLPRRLLMQIGMFDTTLSFGEDYDLWLRCLSAGIPVRLVPEPLAVYRVFRPGSATNTASVKSASDRLCVLRRYQNVVPRTRILWALGYLRHVQLRDALASRRYIAAVGYALKLFCNPFYLKAWTSERRSRRV